eukprot:6173214-Pleurochrysis_carterae.AAC.3
MARPQSSSTEHVSHPRSDISSTHPLCKVDLLQRPPHCAEALDVRWERIKAEGQRALLDVCAVRR